MGAAEEFDGHVVDEGGEAAGAVEGYHARAVAQEDGQGDVVDVKDAAGQLGAGGEEGADVAAVVGEAPVHRVVFDDEGGVFGGVLGEGGEDVQQEVAHVGSRCARALGCR